MEKGKINILLAIKNKGDTKLVKEFLLAEGYLVEHIEQTASSDLAKKNFDVLITDVVVGSHIIAQFQRIKEASNLFLPVLILLPDKEPAKEWLASGFDDILRMPLSKPELKTRLEAFIKIREQSKKLLEYSEEKNRALIDAIPDLIFVLNEQGVFLDYHKPDENILYAPNHSFLGKNIYQVMPTKVANAFLYFSKQVKKSGKPASFDFELEFKYGRRYFEARLSKMHTDNYLIISRDITERKKTDHALQESEERFRKLFEEHVAIQLMIEPKTGKILDANPAAEQFYGWSRQELKQMTIQQINTLPPDIVKKEIEKAKTFKKTLFEFQHRLKNGRSKSVEVFSSKIGEGNSEYLHSIIYDITARKTAELKLKKSEEKFRKAFITSPDSININRLSDGLYVNINDGFTKIMGYTESDIIGKTSVETNIWVDLADRNKLVADLKANGVVENLEAKFRAKSGEIKDGLMSAILIELNGEPHILSIVRDISDRKQAEERIIQEKNKAQQYLNIAEVIMVSIDFSGIVQLINPKGCEILGYSEKEILGKNWFDNFLPERMRENVKEVSKKVFSGETELVRYYENEILTKSGEERIIAWHNAVYKDDNGKVIGALSSGEDITKRKILENELLSAKNKLEKRMMERTTELLEANRELEEFAYSISHDLRAPLRSIMGFSEIIERRYKELLNDEEQKYFNYILESGKQMSDLIDDLLAFARMDKGNIHIKPIDLNRLFDSIFIELNDDIKKSGAKINIQKYLPLVDGTETLLKQVFANILLNAMTYSREGSQPEIEVKAEEQGHRIMIKVKDNGIGIEKEYHDKIFNIFQRLHAQDKYPGTGIGLSIVKKALKAINGEIKVESTLGNGTTMIIYLNKFEEIT